MAVYFRKTCLCFVSFHSLQAGVSCKWTVDGHRVISVDLCNNGIYVGFCLSIHYLRKQLIKLCIYVHCPFLGWHVLSLTKLLTLIFRNSIKFVGNMVAFFLVGFKIIPWRVSLPVVSLCFFLIKSFGFSKGSLLWCSQISEPLNTLYSDHCRTDRLKLEEGR